MIVKMHTDGACLGNPGPGGWAAVLESGGRRLELSGGYRRTTNNRMELMAVIEGLSALKRRSDVEVFSDSKYVVDAINEGWAERWKANGWRRNKRGKALNPDLWDRLLWLLGEHQASLIWIKGHMGDAGNERADELAAAAALGEDLMADEIYEAGSAPASATVNMADAGVPAPWE